MKSKISCIIPAYNESLRMMNVLNVVAKVKEISQIICCIDGNQNDKLINIIKKQFPKITLDVSQSRRGKADAVLSGLNKAVNENVILLDADLIGLKEKEIENAISLFEKYNLDCLLLHTGAKTFPLRLVLKLFRSTLCINGNRITKKQLVLEALKAKHAVGYQLEIAQNKYLMESSRQVAYYPISAVVLGKTAKDGVLKGIINEYKMWKQLIAYAGLPFFLKQSLFFAREKIH